MCGRTDPNVEEALHGGHHCSRCEWLHAFTRSHVPSLSATSASPQHGLTKISAVISTRCHVHKDYSSPLIGDSIHSTPTGLYVALLVEWTCDNGRVLSGCSLCVAVQSTLWANQRPCSAVVSLHRRIPHYCCYLHGVRFRTMKMKEALQSLTV